MDITRAHSMIEDEAAAIKDVVKQLNAKKADSIILFISSKYDKNKIEQAIEKNINCPVYGCQTSGEIGQLGYTAHGISGIAFLNGKTKIKASLIKNIAQLVEGEKIPFLLESENFITEETRGWSARECFGLVLIDGLSYAEENILTALNRSFPDLPIVGGSAGDDFAFSETYVLYEGKFYHNSAVFLLCATSLSFYPFKSQHFIQSEKFFSVTKCDPNKRVVQEFNGRPAALVYAEAIGVNVADLTADIFSKNPLVVIKNNEPFLISVRKTLPDNQLDFFSALYPNEIVRIGRGIDIISSLEREFNRTAECVLNIQAIICFECVLRRLEVINKQLEAQIGEIYASNLGVGFHTYGEQFGPNHVNQTLTGIAIG